ncbi:SMR domain-containing protein At5g58720 isoform X2 [Amaranthus tricolor]|uniref:SMR domain-containing protein At5g58720 isoform X2 n=1 Tax=Amaranthus tricolor TaxID=29722 RepID=UPI002583BD58|nr:SMR domain-containing protein At5g58720 isoform X2 [Amaranthus tricolor]
MKEKMKNPRSKKKRSQVSNQKNSSNCSSSPSEINSNDVNGDISVGEKIILSLVEAFSLVSIEQAENAYKQANGDPKKAALILSGFSEKSELFDASCSSSNKSFGFDSNSNSSEGFLESNSLSEGSSGSIFQSSKGSRGPIRGKKVVAAAGTVSTMLGKDYVTSNPRKEVVKEKGLDHAKVNVEEAEQFLCSMLGDNCELGMGVVRDVLCSCGLDVEKALEVLLDLAAPVCETSWSDMYSSCSLSSSSSTTEYSRNIDCIDNFWQPCDGGYDSNSHSSESDMQSSARLLDFNGRSYAEALASSESSSQQAAANLRNDGSELPRQVLESLFSMPKISECDPPAMSWKNIVKQLESFAHKRVRLEPSSFMAEELNTQAKGDEYRFFRDTARQQWDKMRTCYQKAAAAYSNGEKSYATYMSERGKLYSKMAREADEKASMQIFKARNKEIENALTIDLHGQHVKQAMRLVKLHLLFSTYISCGLPSNEGKSFVERRKPGYSPY